MLGFGWRAAAWRRSIAGRIIRNGDALVSSRPEGGGALAPRSPVRSMARVAFFHPWRPHYALLDLF
jgi:hypothetical protein